MTALASFSSSGFSVTASSAIDYIAGTQAASAGMVSANVRDLATTMHADLGQVSKGIAAQTAQLSAVNEQGFRSVTERLQQGFGSLEMLSGVSIAVQAAGFAVVAKQLGALRGDVRAMHADMVRQGEELIALQRITNAGIERLADFAQRQLRTQEKILEALVSSRTVEAQQLIRQGWDNLKNGYEAEAYERFRRSLDFDNTVYVSHAELGRILEARGELAPAEDHLVRASRFAASAGPEIAGFSRVQLAGFYERHEKLDDAVRYVREALQQFDAPAWRFYLCELLVRRGEHDTALPLLRALINADARFHAAAAGSEALRGLQPKLTALLVELDVQRRSAVLAALAPLAPTVEALDALRTDEATIATVRRNGATLLEQLLVSPFAALEALGEHALNAVQQARQRLDEVCERAAQSFQQACVGATQRIAQTPPTNEPTQVEASLASVKAAVAFVIAGIIGCCLIGSALTQGTDGKTLLIEFALTLGVAGVGAAFLSDRNSIRSKHRKALRPVIAKWREWHLWATGQLRELEQQRAEVLARIDLAGQHVRSPRMHAARMQVQSTMVPNLLSPPAWTQRGEHSDDD